MPQQRPARAALTPNARILSPGSTQPVGWHRELCRPSRQILGRLVGPICPDYDSLRIVYYVNSQVADAASGTEIPPSSIRFFLVTEHHPIAAI